jgi:hypothetical protein
MKYVNALKILRIIRLVTTIVFINEYIKSTSNQFIELYEKLFNLIFKSGMLFQNQQKHRIISFSYFSKFQKNNEV